MTLFKTNNYLFVSRSRLGLEKIWEGLGLGFFSVLDHNVSFTSSYLAVGVSTEVSFTSSSIAECATGDDNNRDYTKSVIYSTAGARFLKYYQLWSES